MTQSRGVGRGYRPDLQDPVKYAAVCAHLKEMNAVIRRAAIAARGPCKQCGNPLLRAGRQYCSRACVQVAGVRFRQVHQVKRSVIRRFFKYVQIASATSCWLWTGTRNVYGIFHIWGAGRSAARVAYRLFVGDLADHLVIDHLCSTPSCVNPLHLQAITQQQNVQLSYARKRERTQQHG